MWLSVQAFLSRTTLDAERPLTSARAALQAPFKVIAGNASEVVDRVQFLQSHEMAHPPQQDLGVWVNELCAKANKVMNPMIVQSAFAHPADDNQKPKHIHCVATKVLLRSSTHTYNGPIPFVDPSKSMKHRTQLANSASHLMLSLSSSSRAFMSA